MLNEQIRGCRLCIVVPCYNEELVLHETNLRLEQIIASLIGKNLISAESKILYVDDGSKDRTFELITDFHSLPANSVLGLKLSRNVGHQNALFAGLMYAKEYFDMVISIDADLQDDLALIYDFVESYRSGYEIVYGVRKERNTDSFFKKHTALAFYKLMNLMGVELIYNHADYRLMSHQTLTSLSNFTESNLFLRGIIPTLGYKSKVIYYDRHERFAGETKYTLKKMFGLAFDGITSFSVKPIRMISVAGGIITGVGVLYSLYTLLQKALGHTIAGWTSLILSIWIIGGFQILSIGLIGEYIGRVYSEVKRRPKYFIESVLDERASQARSNSAKIG